MATKIPNRISVLGGSTVYGQGDPIGGGFVARLRAWHEPKDLTLHRVFNLGVGGDAVAEMLQRGPREAVARRTDFILLYPGLNDTRRKGDRTGPPQTSPVQFEATLRSLLVELQRVAPVAMMSAVPPDESRTSPFFGKWFFTRADAELSTATVARVASEFAIPYLPLFERWSGRADLNQMLADGLHCNGEGHQLLFEAVQSFLGEMFTVSADKLT